MSDKINNQKGVTLLLAMLIMTTVVGVAISLSVLIINQFEFSANLDHAMISLYTAESGLEESLNIIKVNRDDDSKDIDSTLTEIVAKENIPLDKITAAQWDSSGSNIDEYFILDSLEENLETSFDLENVGSIEMTWHENCDDPSWTSWIKMRFVAWQEVVGDFLPIHAGSYDQTTVWPIFPCELVGGVCTTSTKNFPDSSYNYTVTVSPVTCNISYLKIKAYDALNGEVGGGNLLSISNKINLKSVGRYSNSQIAVSASVPYRLPPQGIFSFAIFSEGSLEK